MLSKLMGVIVKHVKNNASTYFFLFITFIIGICAGAFTVNGMSIIQRDELSDYFQGFLQLLPYQKIDSGELLKISLYENARIVLVLWILGVTIIGIPFIYLIVGIRGFITGFTSGFIIEALGFRGVLFTLFAILPKEVVIVPCIIALGVNGIKFSLNMIRKKGIKHTTKESMKANLATYCVYTLMFGAIIMLGILLESYVSPVLIRIIASTVAGS